MFITQTKISKQIKYFMEQIIKIIEILVVFFILVFQQNQQQQYYNLQQDRQFLNEQFVIMEIQFIITMSLLFFYAVYCYVFQDYQTAIHSSYIILIIVYNSIRSHKQSRLSKLQVVTIEQNPNDSTQIKNQTVQNTKDRENKNTCKICNKQKPPRFYHCRRCNTCIFQMDHHCEWLNCCVGFFNFKVYFHILINMFVLGMYALISLLFIDKESWFSASKFIRFLASGFCVWETGKMLYGFIQMVKDNQTLIQSYKRVKGPKKTFGGKLKQVFGGEFSLYWFLPTYANLKDYNIYERTFSQQESDQQSQIKQYTYADQYIYGGDDSDDQELSVIKNKEKVG